MRQVGRFRGLEMQSRIETMRLMAAVGHSVEGVGMVDGRMGKQRDSVTVGMEAEVVFGIVEMKNWELAWWNQMWGESLRILMQMDCSLALVMLGQLAVVG